MSEELTNMLAGDTLRERPKPVIDLLRRAAKTVVASESPLSKARHRKPGPASVRIPSGGAS